MTPPLVGAQTCANCKFMIVVQTQGGSKMACRRYPASVMPIMMPDPRGWPHEGKGGQGVVHVGEVASLPPVEPNFWCGEYVKKVIVALGDQQLPGVHMNGRPSL